MHQQELDRQVDGNVRVGGLTLHRDLPGGPTSQLRRGGAHDMGELPGLRGHPGNRAPRHVPPEVRGLVARREAEANQRRREALGLENGRLNIQEATVQHTRASRPVSTTVPHLHPFFFFCSPQEDPSEPREWIQPESIASYPWQVGCHRRWLFLWVVPDLQLMRVRG